MAEENNLHETFEQVKKHPAPLAVGGAAVAGAVVGSFIPVVGTVIGAGIGGIIGGVAVIANELNYRQGE